MTPIQNDAAPRRIAVVGASGSGKTTFARRLAERLGIPHIELDAIHWGPDWTPARDDDFRARTAYKRRRREYPVLFCQPEYAHLRVVRLASPRQPRLWLSSLPAATPPQDLPMEQP